MATLRLEIVTPETTAYSEDVEMVTLPGSEGELGVYPKHVPVLTILKPGELRVVKDKRATSLAVGEGFIEITPERVSVLTDMALEAQVIDEAAAEKAVARAQAAMKEDHYRGRSRCNSGIAAEGARAIARKTPAAFLAALPREIARARSTRHYRRQRRLPAGPRARGTSSRRSEDSRSCFRRGDRSGTWSARR